MFKNEKESFIYNRYYLTAPYKYFFFQNKREEGANRT